MGKDNVFLASKTVEISEFKNYIELLNRVCYYSEPNANGTRLPYDDKTEERAQTLVGMPVVAKYTVDKLGKPTFKGHEVSIDSNGDIAYGTTPIGVHTEVFIKEDTVELVDKRTATLPCLFARLKIWKRNKNAVSAIKRLYEEDNLHNSWEISVGEYVFKDGIKDLTDYVFDGNALIGVPPAYGDAAKVLALSSKESELLVAEALSQDLFEASENPIGSEVDEMNEEEKIEQQEQIEESSENKEIVENPTPGKEEEKTESESEKKEEDKAEEENKEHEAEKPNDVAELTDGDINGLIYQEIRKVLDTWPSGVWIFPTISEVWVQLYGQPQTSVIVFSYEVVDNAVVLSNKRDGVLVVALSEINAEISAKNDALVSANSKIQELEEIVSALEPYKSAHEQAEAAKAKAAHDAEVEKLRQFAEKSKVFKKEELDSGDVATMISELKSVELKALIADRIVDRESKNNKPEVASFKNPQKEKLDIDSPIVDSYTILKNHIHGK